MREYRKLLEEPTTKSAPENNTQTTIQTFEDSNSSSLTGINLPIIPIDENSDTEKSEDQDSNNEKDDPECTVIDLEATVAYELENVEINRTPQTNTSKTCLASTSSKTHSSSVSFHISSTPRKTPQTSHSTIDPTLATPITPLIKTHKSDSPSCLSPVLTPTSQETKIPKESIRSDACQ